MPPGDGRFGVLLEEAAKFLFSGVCFLCGKIEIPRIIQAQLALVVREAGGWCGRLGAAMGCQHTGQTHMTQL